MVLRAKAYVDFENIYFSIFGQRGALECPPAVLKKRYAAVARAIKEKIEEIIKQVEQEGGQYVLGDVEAFADFEEFERAQSVLDDLGFRPTYVRKYDKDFGVRNNAIDLRMSNTITAEIDDYDLFIIAAGDKDYRDAIDRLHRSIKKIGIIGVEGSVAKRILLRSPYFRSIDPEPIRSTFAVGATPPVEKLFGEIPEEFLYRAVMLRAHRLLVENRWQKVWINKLVESLREHVWFKDLGKAELYGIINKARDSHLMKLFLETRGGRQASFFTPNYLSYLWIEINKHLSSIQKAVTESLQKPQWKELQWVPLNVVIKKLIVERAANFSLSGNTPARQESAETVSSDDVELQRRTKFHIKLWLSMFIEEGAFRTGIRDDPKRPNGQVTGIMATDQCPLWLKVKAQLPEEFFRYAVVLSTLSFFERHSTDWISRSFLSRFVEERFGLKAAEEAIPWAVDRGILTDDEVVHEGRARKAYRLNCDDPFVAKIVATRDETLRHLKELIVDREEIGVGLDVFVDKIVEVDLWDSVEQAYFWAIVLGYVQYIWSNYTGSVVNLWRQRAQTA